jgi:hypothetical protein
MDLFGSAPSKWEFLMAETTLAVTYRNRRVVEEIPITETTDLAALIWPDEPPRDGEVGEEDPPADKVVNDNRDRVVGAHEQFAGRRGLWSIRGAA